MGTNYFHRTNICDCCGRFDERHIGKSSGGWQFSFHGYRPDEVWGSTVSIESWEDWKELLIGEPFIFDEYKKQISLNEFFVLVSKKQANPKNLNHTTYCLGRYGSDVDASNWLDPEGYSFSDTEFS